MSASPVIMPNVLIDEVNIILKGGHGGPGRASFYSGRFAGPDGGNGGRGGDVFVSATSDLTALNQFSRIKLLSAENGELGGSNKKTGADGKDLELIFPLGTSLIDEGIGEEIILDKLNEKILICKGGLGGRGNFELKSPRRTTPKFAQPGLPGQERHFSVILKLIADFGLIGLPNSGKSSLLNELTSAKAPVGDYPFTTLEPNLGVVSGRVMADIPGLIEGASDGKGLGIKFLKHIEKVSTLIHCLSIESDDLLKDYKVVRQELEKFNPLLLKKKEVILLTKSDLLSPKEIKEKVAFLKKSKIKATPMSIFDWDSLEVFKKSLKI
jgi:GTPase